MIWLKSFALCALSRLWSAVRIAFMAGLLSTIPILAVYLNYSVDKSGYFQGDLALREVSNMVLAGENLVGYEQMNEQQRYIMKIIANNMEPLPKVIALGSSRILQLNTEILGLQAGEFFNCALTGGDAPDAMGTFWLYDREDRLPETVIIGFDPWLLRSDALDRRSDKALFAEFLNTKLGYHMPYEKEDTSEKWEALYSPQYFQDNVSFILRSENNATKPQIVTGDLQSQSTEVKCGDGSVLYPKEMRNASQEARDILALQTTTNLLHMEEYPEFDTAGLEIFDRFIAYGQSRGVKFLFYLTPYHPIVYDNTLANFEKYGGFLETEPAIHALAQKYGIEVYGSYNPAAIAGITKADFYDGIHCTGNAIAKLLAAGPVTTPGTPDLTTIEEDAAAAAEALEKS